MSSRGPRESVMHSISLHYRNQVLELMLAERSTFGVDKWVK